MENRIVTNNGVELYAYPNRCLHSYMISVYFKAGVLYEAEHPQGITHMWEHMLFRSLKARYPGRFYEALDRLNLEINACTYKEFVQVYALGTREFARACELICGIFEPFACSQEEFELERRRVIAEYQEGDPNALGSLASSHIWAGTKLAGEVIGTREDIGRVTLSELAEFHAQTLSANNFFLCVTGNFSDGDIAVLKEQLERFPLRATMPDRDNRAPRPEAFGRRDGKLFVKGSKFCSAHLSFDFDWEHAGWPELDILYAYLFQFHNSRIFQELSEETGYVYSYDDKLEQYANLGVVHLQFEGERANLYAAVERALRIFAGLKEQAFPELDYLRQNILDEFQLELDNVEDCNWLFGYDSQLLGRSYRSLEEKRAMYAQVTPESLRAAAREIFRRENFLLTLKGRFSLRERRKFAELSELLGN